MSKFCFDNIPSDLKYGTKQALSLLEITDSHDGIPVTALKADRPYITKKETAVVIGYNKKCEYFRMLGFLESSLTGEHYSETPRHTSLCFMADQSRNGVHTPKTARRLITYLALLGYDSFMLYTEDTYEMDGEPYFGHLRGRWTKEQIKELVEFAENFGIEIIPCIQTLAHLCRLLRWNCYKPLIDCEDIMLVGDEKVKALIDKMFKTAAECFKSRKINVGLDEAHMIGSGNYLDKNGYKPRAEIMLEHINTVSEIAKKYGFEPMMWSDMFFRLQFNGTYVVPEGRLSQQVVEKVPENMTLVYWDYHVKDGKVLDNMFSCHRQFKNKVAFAGGIQRYNRFTAINNYSVTVSDAQLDKAFEYGVTDVTMTSWCSANAESSAYSGIPAYTVFADKCYRKQVDRKWLDTHIEDIFKVPAAPFYLMDEMDYLPDTERFDRTIARFSVYLLFTDILTGLHYKHIDKEVCISHYTRLANEFKKYNSNKNFGYIFETMENLARVCSKRACLVKDIRDAYTNGDKDRLREIADKEIPTAVTAMNEFINAIDRQWIREYRTNGMEANHIRIGAVKERTERVAAILKMYCDGVIEEIGEMNDVPLFADCRDPDSSDYLSPKKSDCNRWLNLISVNRII